MIITKDDIRFEQLERVWQREGGSEFMHNAAMWRRVQDNDEIKYIRVTDQNAFGFYSSQSGRNL